MNYLIYNSKNAGYSLTALFIAFIITLTCLAAPEAKSSTIEKYAKLAEIYSPTISPDGKHIAWLRLNNNISEIIIIDSQSLNITNIVPFKKSLVIDAIKFGSNQHILLHQSEITTARANYPVNFIGPAKHHNKFVYNSSIAYSLNIESGKVVPLLNKTKNILKDQTNLGEITAYNVDKNVVYMDVFDDSSDNKYNLLEVSLDSGVGKLIEKGRSTTFNWYLDASGSPVAREDFNKLTNTYSIRSYLQENTNPIYKMSTQKVPFEILGTSSSNDHLITYHKSDTEEYLANFSLASGEVTNRLFTTTNDNIDDVITGKQHKLFAVSHSGLIPQYTFFDKLLEAQFTFLYELFPKHSIELKSWDDEFNKIVIRVSGKNNAGELFLYQLNNKKITLLSTQYPEVGSQDVADITAFKFTTPDNYELHAMATWPKKSSDQLKNLPTIILPPSSTNEHYQLEYNWLTHYLASQGYLVIQPNHRGLTGFGAEHVKQGLGQWGKLILDDLTSTLDYLVEKRISDPARTCIIGNEVGGYNALLSGALKPEKYRCVISINGISNVDNYLSHITNYFQDNDRIYKYWEEIVYDDSSANSSLNEISPLEHVDNYVASTLLIYSDNVPLIPSAQSKIMYKGLKKARKSVDRFKIKSDKPWADQSDTRIDVLTEITKFLNKHNPA
jgi:dipeptidyl aminopeptidase/acylaminoacyl peptidase